jgi:hypothetical protein
MNHLNASRPSAHPHVGRFASSFPVPKYAVVLSSLDQAKGSSNYHHGHDLSAHSTVVAGVQSQLLVFKSCPDFSQQPVSIILQYLLVLPYITLTLTGVSTTISSLVLTRNFGNSPMLVGRLQKISGAPEPTEGSGTVPSNGM